MVLILSYAIKVAVSTVLIYLSIGIADRGNYRNKLSTAFFTAVVLSFAGGAYFLFLFGLVGWLYFLINWYSIGFFRSFLCVIVYALLFIMLNIFLAVALIGGGAAYSAAREKTNFSCEKADIKGSIEKMKESLTGVLKKKTASSGEKYSTGDGRPRGKNVKIVLTNGRTLQGIIIKEEEKAYLVEIADGQAEVMIRKDAIYRIEDM
jgi:sRNA-binding regulator protein Hfq